MRSPIRNRFPMVKGIWKINSVEEAEGYLAKSIGCQRGRKRMGEVKQ